MTDAPKHLWHVIDRRGKIANCPDAHVKPCADVADAYRQYTLTADADQAERDAYARGVADARKVKPLDMPERRNGYWGHKDGYQVAHTHKDTFRVRFHGRVICKNIKGFSRAVDWANTHNERRIVSALTDPMQTPVDPGQEYDNG
ncbi:MAG: hypothetical protein ACRBB0_05150 [Pelagimonas sp.]|uniref:hypothetical protein n=1 Tax=Pelagimonas sp. TaxID=2073170 RepID=UPI003D6BA613